MREFEKEDSSRLGLQLPGGGSFLPAAEALGVGVQVWGHITYSLSHILYIANTHHSK